MESVNPDEDAPDHYDGILLNVGNKNMEEKRNEENN